MNAMQYWIIDGFIKDPSSGETHYVPAAGEESDDESDDEAWLDHHRRSRAHDDQDSDIEAVTEPLKEANPLPVPVRRGSGKDREYNPETDGRQGGSSQSSHRDR